MKFLSKNSLFITILVSIILFSVISLVFFLNEPNIIILSDGSEEMEKALNKYAEQNSFGDNIPVYYYERGNIENVAEALTDEKPLLIIGPRTSEDAIQLLPYMRENENIFVVSPTVTSGSVVGFNGRFITMSLPNSLRAKRLARTVERDDVWNVYVLTDEINETFSTEILDHFRLEYNGKIVDVLKIGNRNEIRIDKDMKNCDGIVSFSDALSTGILMSMLREEGYEGNFYATEYAFNEDLRLFDKKIIKDLKVFIPIARMPEEKPKSVNFVGTYNALVAADYIMSHYGYDLQKAFNEVKDMHFEGYDGEFSISESFYSVKDYQIVKLEDTGIWED
ncbi:MAG: amino acid ABC transporter substrate-binding protein [Kosmotoga sp.]|nr:MAG: amino acid ABC transporter substrate-binding protein [Kosmotoga sp.]